MHGDSNKYLPYSGRRYSVNQYGEVLDANGMAVASAVKHGHLVVEIEWLFGKKEYQVGLLILAAYAMLDLPEHLWMEIEPLYKDENILNTTLSNLVYRFRNGPLEVESYPGYFYIPYYTRYAIDTNGILLNVESGKTLTWHKTKPCLKRNSTGGYSSARVMTGAIGRSCMLFRHKALCLTFKPYSSNVFSLIVNHLDGDPRNDDLLNIEWSTYSDNNKHAYAMGLRPNATRAVLYKDLTTGTIIRYGSVSACALALGIKNPGFISYRVQNSQGKVFEDMRLFKYDDGTEWPVISESDIRLCRAGVASDIMARNVYTGEVVIFTGCVSGERVTGVKHSTIARHTRENEVIPIMGYNFRYMEGWDGQWPVHTAEHLLIYRKYPVNPPDGVIVTDLETNTRIFFLSSAEASAEYGIRSGYIASLISEKVTYRQKYLFEYYRLRDNLSPPPL